MQDFKEAYQSAKKELDQETKRKLIDEMKGYIKTTLQAIEDKKSEIADKQQELKALKADLDDLENGRLDKIKERQDKDPVARRVSVIFITKIINNYPSVQPYFQPYWENVPCVQTINTIATNTSLTLAGSTNNLTNFGAVSAYNTSDVSGTYTVKSSGGIQKAYYLKG